MLHQKRVRYASHHMFGKGHFPQFVEILARKKAETRDKIQFMDQTTDQFLHKEEQTKLNRSYLCLVPAAKTAQEAVAEALFLHANHETLQHKFIVEHNSSQNQAVLLLYFGYLQYRIRPFQSSMFNPDEIAEAVAKLRQET
jgi:hypothetical protein